ncbi:MAG: alpha/beta hydrolase [Alphaproteobacteria bacterium]|nr:alpha/beta hydrolase [Alphaproteobacteria bacterium]
MNEASAKKGYKQFRADEMEAQFNPRVALGNVDTMLAERAVVSAEVRKRLKHHANVAYGKGPREVMDIFPAERAGAPVHIYIHGGYWRAVSKNDVSFIAEAFHAAGVTTVVLEYELCPKVTVADIVRQARAGIAWVYRNIAQYGGDPHKIYLSGSSAGGHLVAMAVAYDWEKTEKLPKTILKGAVAITGVMDTAPVAYITPNDQIKMTPEVARETNPMTHPPLPGTPYAICVGGDETVGWRQMSRDYFDMCRAKGIACTFHEVPNTHHFSITNEIGVKGSLMQRVVFEQMGIKA